jgi:hypothetical protein
MDNWIGIGLWIVLGVLVATIMKVVVKRPEETPGHVGVILALGAFAAVVGGMLGVGIFSFYDPASLSLGGMGGAFAFAVLMTWIYRWGTRSLV